MNQTQSQTRFEEELRDELKLKNVPNAHFDDETFSFEDYVMRDRGEWAFLPEEEMSTEGAARRSMLDVYRTFLGGTNEITVVPTGGFDEEDGDFFVNVVVTIPDNEDRQYDLARLVIAAWNERTRR